MSRYLKSPLNQWFLCGYTWLHLHILMQLVSSPHTFGTVLTFVISTADIRVYHRRIRPHRLLCF